MPGSFLFRAVLPVALAATLGGLAFGESPRAELGKRLRRFERAWQEADPQRRAATVAPMQAAVKGFFSLQLDTAAARLDDAWLTVRDRGPAEPAERQAIATAVTVEPILADRSCAGVTACFAPLYATPAADDPRARLRLTIEDAGGRPLVSREGAWSEAEGSLAWATGPLPAGDHAVVVERRTDAGDLVVSRLGISRVDRLDARLATIRDTLAARPAESSSTGQATVAAIAELLGSLADSQGLETDYPAARLLAFAEAILAAGNAPGETIAAEARRADCWLTLSAPGGRAAVRLRAPPAGAGPLPVLFLLHGAGGSENMFFDACGAGRTVALAIDRGWLVVAPRQGLLGLGLGIAAMLDALEEIFEVDRSRIFVVGHSMGAVQATKQAAVSPGVVAAAAALGGGGKAPSDAEARRIPWFVAAGAADFGRPAAAALADDLRAAGNPVEERILPDVEHMVVVQAALDELFTFLDASVPP